MISVTVKKNFSSSSVAKQLPFAIASALTKTVKQAQTEIINTLDDKFTLRNSWYKPSSPLGIKVKPAKKNDLRAEVGTNFDQLEKFETGRDKTPRGSHLAIPTGNVRRTKRDIIRRSQRPNSLRGKRTFVLNTKAGKVLFQRKYKGKRSQIVALYNLETRARIKQNSPVINPAKRTIIRSLGKNLHEALANALKTAR